MIIIKVTANAHSIIHIYYVVLSIYLPLNRPYFQSNTPVSLINTPVIHPHAGLQSLYPPPSQPFLSHVCLPTSYAPNSLRPLQNINLYVIIKMLHFIQIDHYFSIYISFAKSVIEFIFLSNHMDNR